MANSPSLAVIIPVRNGARTIEAQLRALAEQKSPWPWEVIVADNGSTNSTRAIVNEMRTQLPYALRLVDASDRPGANHARNTGLRAARASHFVFVDADDRVRTGWLTALQSAFAEGADLVAGAISSFRRTDDAPMAVRSGVSEAYGFLPWACSANLGVTRDVFERAGGFDENYRGGAEDVEFLWRAQIATGKVITFVPDAIVDKGMRDSLRAAWLQQYRYSFATIKLFWEFREYGMPKPGLLSDFHRSSVAAAKDMQQSKVDIELMVAMAGGRLAGSLGRYFVKEPPPGAPLEIEAVQPPLVTASRFDLGFGRALTPPSSDAS